MNADRRKRLSSLHSDLEVIKDGLENIAAEEQEFYDNMPENMQNGDKGERAQNAVSELEAAVEACDGIISNIETAQE